MKVVFPIPRMGRSASERRPFFRLATTSLIVVGLALTGLVLISQKYLDSTTVTFNETDPNADFLAGGGGSKGILASFTIASDSTDGSSTSRVRGRPTSRTPVRTAPRFPATQKVLDLLDGLLVTHQYTPYFIIYNREVEMLQTALRELAGSSERGYLSQGLLRYIDEASYAHTKLRDAWRIKTNPLKSAEDVRRYLRSVRVSVSVAAKPFRTLPGAKKKSAYEQAAAKLIGDARSFTEKARSEFARLGRDAKGSLRNSNYQLHDGGLWGN